MGAGGKAINIFKFNKGDDPDQVINWRLWFVCKPNSMTTAPLLPLGGLLGRESSLVSLTQAICNSQLTVSRPCSASASWAPLVV